MSPLEMARCMSFLFFRSSANVVGGMFFFFSTVPLMQLVRQVLHFTFVFFLFHFFFLLFFIIRVSLKKFI